MAELMEFPGIVVEARLVALDRYGIGKELRILLRLVLSCFWVDLVGVMALYVGNFMTEMVLVFLNWVAFKSLGFWKVVLH